MSRVHWVALSLTPGVGGKTMRRLLEHFGSAEAVFEVPDEALLAVPRIGEKALRAIRTVQLEQVEAELLSLEDEGIACWPGMDDEDYPANLRTALLVPDETGWDEIVKTVVEWQPQPAATSATHQPNLWFDS